MHKKKDFISSQLNLLVVGFGCLILIAAVGAILAVVLLVHASGHEPQGEMKSISETTLEVAELSQQSLSDTVAHPATINNASLEQAADEKYFTVYWLEDDSLQEVNSTTREIVLSANQSYNFSLTVQIGYQTAENVRIFARMPRKLSPGEQDQIEVLVMADNAIPYYDTITILYPEESVFDVNGEQPDNVQMRPDGDASTSAALNLAYREDSTVIHSNASVDGAKLDAKQLFAGDDGVLLGTDQLDGTLLAGKNSFCVISWVVDTTASDDSTSHHHTSITTTDQGRLWEKYQQGLEASRP